VFNEYRVDTSTWKSCLFKHYSDDWYW